jgi:hypothetical protein
MLTSYNPANDPCLPPKSPEVVEAEVKQHLVEEQGELAFWKRFLKVQMENNMDLLVRDSIKDFHVPGFNYICFQFAPNMTVRLYITLPKDGINTGAINIHNHLYDSQMLSLAGGFVNHVFAMVPGDRFHYWHLTSALHPDNDERRIRLDRLGKTGLKKISSRSYGPGETHFQAHDEIHMVTTDKKQFNAFMIWEFPTIKEHSMLFSRNDYGDTIPTPGAYNRFTADEIRELIERLLEEMP